MSMYKEVSPNLNFVEREQETEKFWEENHIFEKSMEERQGDNAYVFYDGPPHRQRQAPHRPLADPGL